MKKYIFMSGAGIVFISAMMYAGASLSSPKSISTTEDDELVVVYNEASPATIEQAGDNDIVVEAADTPSNQDDSSKDETIADCPTGNTLSLDAFLFPMSKSFSIDEAYIPEDLVPVAPVYTKNGGRICVTEATNSAIETMFENAKKDGYDLYVTSGFRSSDTQRSLFEYYTEVFGLEDAARRSAFPGHSEHQLGTTVDITGGESGATSHTFGETPEGMWLEEYAPSYGFVLSYPEDKESVTGYIYEPWHFRYVGEEVAETVQQKKKTLGEYLLDLYEPTQE